MDKGKPLERELLEISKQKERSDKLLLSVEIILGVMSLVISATFALIAALVPMQNWLKVLLITSGLIFFFLGATYALKIEQVAGFYECAKCRYRYVPTFKSVFLAAHIQRTRHMKCPKCGQRSWHKKVLTKDLAENKN